MKLSIKEKVGYGLGDTASNFVWALMMNFIMFYYTDIFGITAAAAGYMLLFARCTDGFIDFGIGAIADRTKTKWGRFRPYLIWLCMPLAIVFILAFTTPNFNPHSKLVYAWITYNLLMFFYSAINIPYGALSGVMTDDSLERTSLNSYRMGLAQVGGIIANSSFLILIPIFGGTNADPQVNQHLQQIGAQRVVIMFSAIAVILFIITFLTTQERIHPAPEQKTSLGEDLKNLFTNPHWVLLFAFSIVNITFAVVRGTAQVYYLKNYLMWNKAKDERIFWYFLVFGLAMILGATFTRLFVKAMGKKGAFIFSLVCIALSAVPFYFMPSSESWPVLIATFAVMIFGQIFTGINATLFWALVADTADFAEWKFRVRTTGVVFSATTCAQKAGMGLGAAFAGWLLSHFGYVANSIQTAESLWGIRVLFSLIPAAGLILLAFLLKFYGLTEEMCAKMREDLIQRRIGR